VRPADEPLALSGSAVDAVGRCSLRWFLDREAGGGSAQTTATGFGSVVHALAAAVVAGEVAPDLDQMRSHLDRVWSRLDFAVPWAGPAERREAGDALGRFIDWHRSERGRWAVAAEHEFAVAFEVGGEPVTLRGSMDRVEVDAEGQVVVVDLKTGKSAPAAADIAGHAQLGAYQLAVHHGALDGIVHPGAQVGGAELLQLRASVRGRAKVQRQPALDPDAFTELKIAPVVRTIREESFAGTPGEHCRHCEFATSCPAQAEGAHLMSAQRAERSAVEVSDV